MRLVNQVLVNELLKNNLSSYLRDVKSGTLVLVTDRNQVVAILKEPDIEYMHKDNTLINEWANEGKLIPGNGKKFNYQPTGIKLKKGTGLNLLNQDRDE